MSQPSPEDTHGPPGAIKHSLDLVGLTSDDRTDPRLAVQYAVLAASGSRLVFGDQEWVESGEALNDFPEGSVVQKRTITITYGEWENA